MESNEKRQYYETLFKDYPDVVDTKTVCAMLGGIGLDTVWGLVRYGSLRSINYLGQRYLIPKEWLIDYLLSDHYAQHKNTYKAQV